MLKRCLCPLLLCISLFSTTIAAESLPLLVARGDGEYPPYEMHVNDQLTGTHIDLIRTVAKQLGREVNFISVPWKRALYLVKEGKVDDLSYVGRSKEREGFLYFHEGNAMTTVRIGFIARADRKAEINYTGNLQSLTPYSIGEQRGFYYGEAFETANYLARRDFDSLDKVIDLIRERRLDIGLFEVGHYLYRAEKGEFLADIAFLSPLLSHRKMYLGFSKARGHDQLSLQFAEAMSSFMQTPAYEALLSRYGLVKEK